MKNAGRFCAIALLILASAARADNSAQITATLDGFHAAAAGADSAAYFGYMTEDFVFLGTDGTERWQGSQFREFVQPRFEAGKGWSYQSVARNITISPDASTAWFDETLSHTTLGSCRGSGVLVLEQDHWKIAQYNLSVPIPNAMVLEVADQIARLESGQDMGDTGTATTAQQLPEPKKGNCTRKGHKSNPVAGC